MAKLLHILAAPRADGPARRTWTQTVSFENS